mgnify:CR=1 FL=1
MRSGNPGPGLFVRKCGVKRRKDYAEEKARRIGGNAQQGITLRNKGPKDLESEAL